MRGIRIVARKEIQETLRDWRTLLMMVGVPVLMYPALLVFTQQLALFGIRRVEAEPARVALAGAMPEELRSFLDVDERIDLLALTAPATADESGWIEVGAAAVRRGDVDAVAVWAPASEALGTSTVTLLFDETRERSQRARGVLHGSLQAWGDTLLVRRLGEHHLPGTFGQPLALADSSLARPQERGGYLLGRFLPVLLIMIALLGAFYPAIDLAAGEKERGTLETLLTSPIAPSWIVLGKFVTVALVALVAAALNLGSMALTLRTGLFQLETQGPFDFSLPPLTILWVAVVLVPMAALFAAVFLGIAVRSHSFKEAQNALTPVLMLVLLPALLPILPGVDLSAALALVPVAGPALLFRDLMAGDASMGRVLLVLAATSAHAAVALGFAVDAFAREQILFGSGRSEVSPRGTPLRERIRGWRGQARAPGPGQALVFLAGVAALNFFVAPELTARLGIHGGLLAAQWLLMMLPALAFVALPGFDIRRTLSLARPSARQLLGALLVIAGGTPLAWFLAWLQSLVMPIPEELVEALRRLVTAESTGELIWLIAVAAVTPAFCEEFLFRGVLLGSSRASLSATRAIALNAFVFAIFHLSFVRLLPTAWLGVLLTWVVWRTRSIWTSVLMHGFNNGLIVLLATLPATRAWGTEGTEPPSWFLAPIGLLLLIWGIRILRAAPPAGERPADNA